MDRAGGLATIENRLGRAGGLAALCDPGLCHDLPVLALPILTRSAALLTLLLQDGIVDMELTGSVVALDPGLAFGILQVANQEQNNSGEIWQLPLAVVTAGCERLQAMVHSALKVESSYDCATGTRLRHLYLRCVQRACIAEFLAPRLGSVNPEQAYVAGLLFGLTGGPTAQVQPGTAHSPLAVSSPADGPTEFLSSSAPQGRWSLAVESVLLADSLLELCAAGGAESSEGLQELAFSALWQSRDGCGLGDRRRLLSQGCAVARWAAANAPRLSPWEFTTRLRRRTTWE